MANVGFWPLQARQKGIKEVHIKVTIGATGASTLSADASLGVASISRTSAGLYVITLRDKYTALVNASFMHLDDALQNLSFQVNAETVASTKTITLWTRVVATATDPTDTAIIYGTLTLKNSSV
jgi:hypothetical protein